MKASRLGLAALLIAVCAAQAQQAPAPHDGHAMPAGAHAGHAAGAARSPATEAYEAASVRMHKDMAIAYTGDPDADFLRSMIPHHRGALDMASVVLAHGRDPAVRKLAEEVVAAQEREIAAMEGHLKRLGR
jgi:uncharacterized protein (DUF305 family)